VDPLFLTLLVKGSWSVKDRATIKYSPSSEKISAVERRRNSSYAHSRRVACQAATIIWAVALLAGSLQPRRPANFHSSPAHQVAHFLGFGLLALLAAVSFGKPGAIGVWPVLSPLFLGVAIEFLEHWKNEMPVEWYDVREDAVGILVFAAIWHLYQRAARPTSSQMGSRTCDHDQTDVYTQLVQLSRPRE
jgi:hypothetical protein